MSEGEGSNDPGETNEVLSSIRKLVADDAEARKASEDAGDGDDKPAPLILTKDLRVGEAETEAEESKDAEAPEEAAPEEAASEEVASDPVASFPPVGLRLVEAKDKDEALSEEEAEATVAAHFDEPQLKELVAEMVREELRGELGEKITRNIRKMVRREIAKALEEDDGDRLDI